MAPSDLVEIRPVLASVPNRHLERLGVCLARHGVCLDRLGVCLDRRALRGCPRSSKQRGQTIDGFVDADFGWVVRHQKAGVSRDRRSPRAIVSYDLGQGVNPAVEL